MSKLTIGFGHRSMLLSRRFRPIIRTRKFHLANSFVQDSPHLENAFLCDPFLKRNLKRILPPDAYLDVEPDLIQFGHRVCSDIWDLGMSVSDALYSHFLMSWFIFFKGQQCEENQPYLKSASAWGNNEQVLVTSSAWQSQKALSAREGLVAIAYEKKYHQFSRIYQAAK